MQDAVQCILCRDQESYPQMAPIAMLKPVKKLANKGNQWNGKCKQGLLPGRQLDPSLFLPLGQNLCLASVQCLEGNAL